MKKASDIAEFIVFGRPAVQVSETQQAMNMNLLNHCTTAIEAYGKECRDQALDDAITACNRHEKIWDNACQSIAREIRALKEKP